MNPQLLPKVRSESLRASAKLIPCTARISLFVPGHRCASQDTNVFCHGGNVGKGMSTKVSDLNGFVGCINCHDLYDRRDKRVWDVVERYPSAFYERIMNATFETQAHWVSMGLITGPDWVIV